APLPQRIPRHLQLPTQRADRLARLQPLHRRQLQSTRPVHTTTMLRHPLSSLRRQTSGFSLSHFKGALHPLGFARGGASRRHGVALLFPPGEDHVRGRRKLLPPPLKGSGSMAEIRNKCKMRSPPAAFHRPPPDKSGAI